MKIGYARVSTNYQNLEIQKEALQEAGCEKIFEEKASAGKERKELNKLINQLRKGDVVIVWKLDRLGRTTLELIKLINEFNEKGIKFKSLNDSLIDTTTPNGKLVFSIFSALAEHEREIIRERTRAGLKSARAKGRKGGRPKGLSEDAKNKAAAALTLYNKGKSVKEILKGLNISKATLYRYLRYEGLEFNYNNKNLKNN
jgi:DNA invertase Pin-like site-specific DNA recombinase